MRSISFVVLLAIGCDGAADTLPIPETLPADGRTYVIDSIEMGGTSSEVTAIGVDLDGDEVGDNAFGQWISALSTQLEVDVDAEIAEALGRGELLHLLMFATDETGAVLDTGRLFLGADTDDDPANNFTGSAELTIRPDSNLDDAAFGVVSTGAVDLARGRLTVENVLFAPIRMPLNGARIIGTFDEDGRFTGRIAGGIADIGRLRLEIVEAVAGEANEMCDPGQIPCCPEGSRGEVYVTTFDTDDDCRLDAQEVDSHFLFDLVFSPDLDLDEDREDESISVGFRVTAVPARFDVP